MDFLIAHLRLFPQTLPIKFQNKIGWSPFDPEVGFNLALQKSGQG